MGIDRKGEPIAVIDAPSEGEAVLIQTAGAPAAKPVRCTGAAARRTPGALKGRIKIHEGSDELPPDLAAAFGVEP